METFLEIGWHWVEHNGFAEPARWDGEKWHLHGTHFENKVVLSKLDNPTCPTGCTCVTNADGSVTVLCA